MTGRDTMTDVELLPGTLRQWAMHSPGKAAVTMVDDAGEAIATLTYDELYRRAHTLATVVAATTERGDRVLIASESALGFLAGFLACLISGRIAVPVILPRRNKMREATRSIFHNCRPRFILTDAAAIDSFRVLASEARDDAALTCASLEEMLAATHAASYEGPDITASDIAFLQYTSGSTSEPKGVMVSHANLRANLRMIAARWQTGPHSRFVSWIPLFHDMGLILVALHALYVGGACIFMRPALFSQRPLQWLRVISKYRADISGAPNFAYDLCVSRLSDEHATGLDLSSWRIAFNAAEPVQAETIRRFTRAFARYGFDGAATYACYGLAEATVFATGDRPGVGPQLLALDRTALEENRIQLSHGPHVRTLVACGTAVDGERIRVVDPDTRVCRAERELGEIWIGGPNIARGYWERPVLSDETFRATLSDGTPGRFLRTGDLGFLDNDRVYIAGRRKDMMILRGRNLYPQDIEKLAEAAHPALRPTCSAAVTVGNEEDVALVLIAEVERSWRNKVSPDAVTQAVRAAIVGEFDIHVHDVVLIEIGTIPKTSSGKIRRREARQRYLAGALPRIDAALAAVGGSLSNAP